MKKIYLTIILLFIAVASYGQSNNCQTSVPFVDDNCEIYFPNNPTSITRCYSFVSPKDSIDFSFVPFLPQGNCLGIPLYELYDINCNIYSSNNDGFFIELIPNNQYIICYTLECFGSQIGALCTSELIVLPIKLIEFKAFNSDQGIILKWITAMEDECLGYYVERSTNLEKWTPIGFIDGKGTTFNITNYAFIDNNPISGVNYYRLKQVDFNGEYEYFNVVAIFWIENEIFNPFRIYNFLGQRVN
jgi:hypothetical protein